jgi:hypothetical protein
MATVRATLRYQGETYTVTDTDELYADWDFTEFMWTGAGSVFACDCLRSQLIAQQCVPDAPFPALPCGHQITLVALERLI